MRYLRPLALLLFALVPASAMAVKGHAFVGCTESKVFHRARCKMVQDVEKAGTKVQFSRRAEAVQAGYKPCGTCKP